VQTTVRAGATALDPAATTAAPGETAATVPDTAAPAGEPAATTAPPAPAAPGAASNPFPPPDPGTYTTRTTGTAVVGLQRQDVDETTTRTVERLSGTDVRQTEGGDQGASVTVLRYLPDQVLLLSLEVGAGPGLQYRFASEAGVLFLRLPPAPGDSWEWTLTSEDGGETVTQATTVGPVERIEVAGVAIEAPRLDTTITLSGDLDGTVQLTSWLDPARRTTARAHQVSDLTYAGFRLTSDTTSDLVSFEPA
jgi:hypothetical protein